MKYLPLIALLLATPVAAKDIAITLTDQEQKTFLGLLDTALKCGGVNALPSVNQFIAKYQGALNVVPVTPEKKK